MPLLFTASEGRSLRFRIRSDWIGTKLAAGLEEVTDIPVALRGRVTGVGGFALLHVAELLLAEAEDPSSIDDARGAYLGARGLEYVEMAEAKTK